MNKDRKRTLIGSSALFIVFGLAFIIWPEEAKNAIRRLGLKVEKVADFPADGTAHTVIVLRKISPTPAQYPRRYAKIKQSPL